VHPAFSVIFFTTASGAGFGLFAWLGFFALVGELPPRLSTLVALALGTALSAAGLLSSLGHLGQPQRAWMAFSQWRSSWLSREGVFAILCFVPALALAWLAWHGSPHHIPSVAEASLGLASTSATRIAGAFLGALAMASVVCTAMIYASLKPIPAWRHPLVLPVYLVFALVSGGLLLVTVTTVFGSAPWFLLHPSLLSAAVLINLALPVGAVALGVMKLFAWRSIDSGRVPVSRNDALGLPHARPVQVFERPHTEANYLLKEMGYVLARKHAKRLRVISLLLFAVAPALLLVARPFVSEGVEGILLLLASLSALAGAMVERWLFFAEARHLVTLYY
jgi:DMSO reductase anchor subunit